MANDNAFGPVLDGGGIRSLSLTKPDHSPYNSEELGYDADEELPVMLGDGPCWICDDGPRAKSYCGFQYHCRLDLKVGEDYKVICLRSSNVVNAKCEKGCMCPYEQVMEKVPYTLKRLPENGQ
ncbi:hypothetical protein CASFOL_041961 [Castilleja foliolosa]|uniref:Uncharacterized protein n=1 Tax=Castilleja foliolosa TaxID=1961234 RepID=A0ABD3B972_9LAMI